MARSNTTLNFYKIEKPAWSQVNQSHKDTLASIITTGGWREFEGLRRGFLNCKLEGDVLYGYFAQEGRIKIEQYNEAQQPRAEETESFERILFLLLLTPGVLAIQNIRVARYIDLRGTEIRKNFINLLEEAFRKTNLTFSGIVINRYKEELTRDELIHIFENHAIKRIKVNNLLNAQVPSSFKFFNPDFDKDVFLKAIIDDDLKNTDETEWQGTDIQDTKIARGLIHTGNPTLLEGVDDSGQEREWMPSTPQKMSLELDTDTDSLPEEDLKRLLESIGRVFGLFNERIKQFQNTKNLGNLPLFSTGIDE